MLNIPQKENFMIHNGFAKKLPAQTLKPLISKHFSAYTIMKRIKTIFKESGAVEETKKAIRSFTQKAFDALAETELPEKNKALLKQFGESLMERTV